MSFAGLASVPERVDSLARTVESLLPQVDRVGVYLDGYPDVPACLDDKRIAAVRSQDDDRWRDRRDAGKFYWADEADGYYVSCDDDIVYPGDYVQTLVDAIERYGREAVVGLHGREYGRPAQAFGGYFANYHCLRDVAGEHPVHLLGTGTLAYHTSTIRVSRDDFEQPNMADVWFAKLAQRQRVPLVVLPHRAGWIHHTNHARTIASECSAGTGSVRDTRALQERVVASTRWQLNTPAGDADLHPVGAAVVATKRGDHISNVLARGSWYEADLLERLRACGASGVYVDVGAHVGNHTAFFATECAAERVVAIEPNPDSYRRLLATITGSGLQGRVRSLRAAVHPTWTSAHVLAGPDANTGMARVERGGIVPVVRLDETLNGDRVGLIKVDVDGLGVEVLRTASGVIARDRPVLAVETDDPAAISSLLDPHGYRRSERSYASTPVWVWEPDPDPGQDVPDAAS